MKGTILDEHNSYWGPHRIDYQGLRQMWLEHGISTAMVDTLGCFFETEDGEWITGKQIFDHGFTKITLTERSRILWMYGHNYYYLLNKGDREGFQKAMAMLYYQAQAPMSELEQRWVSESLDRMTAARDAFLKQSKENIEKRKGVKLDG